MNMADFNLDIVVAAMFAAMPGVIAIILNFRKNKKEESKLDADTENVHAEAADKWANQVNNLLDRVGMLEAKVVQLESELNRWKDWAARLVKQVRSLGHEPVPFEDKAASE